MKHSEIVPQQTGLSLDVFDLEGDLRKIGFALACLPSEDFANRLLNEAGVAALPGTAFGQYGEGYLRFSFANSRSSIEAALERIKGFVSLCLGG